MAVNFDTTNFNNFITDGVTNSGFPSNEEMNNGIKYNSKSDAVLVNKFLYSISKAIEYIQKNGSILWQKDKEYSQGSIVNVIESETNFFNIRKFRCISTQTTTEYPLIGSLNIDNDRLTTYFSGVTSVNSSFWEEIIDKGTFIYNLNVPEETKGISLFNIPTSGYHRSNADVIIKRFNSYTSTWDTLIYTFDFECLDYNNTSSNCTLNIYDVMCDNYNRSTYQPTYINGTYVKPSETEYIFGTNKFTLLGITMSLKNNSLNIDIYSDNYSCIDRTKDIMISINVNSSTVSYSNIELSTYNGYTGKDVVVIREGYNNTGNDCGYIVESPILLTKEQQFKRSLLHICEENCMNNALRPGFSKNFPYQFNPDKVYNVVSDSTNKDYSKHVLPRIKGTMYPNGDKTSYRRDYWPTCTSSPLFFGWVNRKSNNVYNVPAAIVSNLYNQNQMKSTVLMDSGNKNDNIFLSKNPELNAFDQEPKLFPRSKKVYRYFKY